MAAFLALSAVFGVSSQAVAAIDAASMADRVVMGGPATLATWVPWDGNQITSAANCESRRQFIARTYNIKLSNLRCDRIDIGIPPCPVYRWILMVNADAAPVPSVSTVRPARDAGSVVMLTCA